jgi:hypothetical protein
VLGAGALTAQRNMFRVGNVTVQVEGGDRHAVALVPSLMSFQVESEAADIDIRIEHVRQLGSVVRRSLFDSGSVWKLYQDDFGFQFDFCAPVFGNQPYKRLFVDPRFSRGTLQLSDRAFIAFPSAAPLDYPLDELLVMHRLTQENAIELHACGIVMANGDGNLFVGHSGAGKSTTTRLWTAAEDVEVLSDDRIIVRRDDGVEKQIPRCARNDNPKRNDTPKHKMRMYGTPWHGEAMHASPNSALLNRIFILEHGHGNVLTQLSPSQAVAELFARSFVPFYRHEYVESALQFLEELADAVPCYRYAFEPQLSAVERILEFRD